MLCWNVWEIWMTTLALKRRAKDAAKIVIALGHSEDFYSVVGIIIEQ